MTEPEFTIHVYCSLIVYSFYTLLQTGFKTFRDSSAFLIIFHFVVTSWILHAPKMSAMVLSRLRLGVHFLASNT